MDLETQLADALREYAAVRRARDAAIGAVEAKFAAPLQAATEALRSLMDTYVTATGALTFRSAEGYAQIRSAPKRWRCNDEALETLLTTQPARYSWLSSYRSVRYEAKRLGERLRDHPDIKEFVAYDLAGEDQFVVSINKREGI